MTIHRHVALELSLHIAHTIHRLAAQLEIAAHLVAHHFELGHTIGHAMAESVHWLPVAIHVHVVARLTDEEE